VGISSLGGSINFVVTILRFRFSSQLISYSYMLLSLYCFSIIVTSWLLILSVPVLAACIAMIILDRHFNSSFFNPYFAGDPVLF
jgi:cytochrome c oxidase subunit 1